MFRQWARKTDTQREEQTVDKQTEESKRGKGGNTERQTETDRQTVVSGRDKEAAGAGAGGAGADGGNEAVTWVMHVSTHIAQRIIRKYKQKWKHAQIKGMVHQSNGLILNPLSRLFPAPAFRIRLGWKDSKFDMIFNL